MAPFRKTADEGQAQAPAKTSPAQRVRKAATPRARKAQAPAASTGGTHALDRERMIRQAAYYRAERRGFLGGSPEQDWLEAEAEVDQSLAMQAAPAGKA
ncbi:MAG: DUF2934 domain-containing protein [Thermodesulfobacteriota bacterium]